MEEIGLGKVAIDELLKQGPLGVAILVLCSVIVVLWKDNLRLRAEREADQKVREERDDARFAEVKTIAEASSTALAKSAGAETALGAALEHTNQLVEKQGDVIEARTAIINTLNASVLLLEAAVKTLADRVERLERAR